MSTTRSSSNRMTKFVAKGTLVQKDPKAPVIALGPKAVKNFDLLIANPSVRRQKDPSLGP